MIVIAIVIIKKNESLTKEYLDSLAPIAQLLFGKSSVSNTSESTYKDTSKYTYNYNYTSEDLYRECMTLLKGLHNEYYWNCELIDYDDGDTKINIEFDNGTKRASMYLNDKYGFVFRLGADGFVGMTFDEVDWNVIEKVNKMLGN